MLGKVFWVLVALLLLAVLAVPFVLPSSDESTADGQYIEGGYAEEGEGEIELSSKSRKKSKTSSRSRSARSLGGSRSYRGGK